MKIKPKIELCASSIEAVFLAGKYHFDRIELCQVLENGGITPSIAFQKKALKYFPNTHVLIRCRAGNFIYTEIEKQIMFDDIAASVQLGIPGVVLGSLNDDLSVDTDFIREVKTSFPFLELTFHRAFDDIAYPLKAINILIKLGVKRILTSGGTCKAYEGIKQIQACLLQAENKIEIMIGGGINQENLLPLLKELKPDAVHFSGTNWTKPDDNSLFATELLQVNEAKIKSILSSINDLNFG